MVRVTGIQFQQNGKVFHFDAGDLPVRTGDYVIADTERGIDLGQVVLGVRETPEEQLVRPLKKLVRIATQQDIQHGSENRIKENEAFSICQKKIAEHKLEMKLVSVECAFDNSKILFYFTANGRVDFRSLVKDLASVFKSRIELRQIGVRDEARMLGGLGPCGRPICCGTFLDDFQPVSIKMAKEQNLSLNPTKISGVCGRLMCCLKYEQDHYEQTRKRMPRVGREVNTPDGSGTVTDLNIVKETVFVRIVNGDSGEIKEYTMDQLSPANPRGADGRVRLPKQADQPADTHENEDGQEGINQERTASVSDREHTAADPSSEETSSGKKTEGKDRKRTVRKDEKGAGDKQKKSQKLGQPVRRENPKKVNPAPDGQAADSKSSAPDNSTMPSAAAGSQKNASWAEALEKAMKAIDE